MICTDMYQSKYSLCWSVGLVQWQNTREYFHPRLCHESPEALKSLWFLSLALPLPLRASCSLSYPNACWCRFSLWHLVALRFCRSLFLQEGLQEQGEDADSPKLEDCDCCWVSAGLLGLSPLWLLVGCSMAALGAKLETDAVTVVSLEIWLLRYLDNSDRVKRQTGWEF